MSNLKRWVTRATILLMSLFAPLSIFAEVVRVEVRSRADFSAGKSFGSVGAYEQLEGRIFFSADPRNPLNAVVADIQNAPRNPQGAVEFSADFVVIKPKMENRGN